MIGHYGKAQIVEVFEAIEKIKGDASRWDVSLESPVWEVAGKRSTGKLPEAKKAE